MGPGRTTTVVTQPGNQDQRYVGTSKIPTGTATTVATTIATSVATTVATQRATAAGEDGRPAVYSQSIGTGDRHRQISGHPVASSAVPPGGTWCLLPCSGLIPHDWICIIQWCTGLFNMGIPHITHIKLLWGKTNKYGLNMVFHWKSIKIAKNGTVFTD